MQLRKLDRGELIAVIGGAVLGLSLALQWYSLGNKYAILNGCKGPSGSCTGWASLSILRFVFLAAALAPAILAYIVARGHALSWPRGELTAIIALVALVFVVFRGIIDKPGQPPAEISVDYGCRTWRPSPTCG